MGVLTDYLEKKGLLKKDKKFWILLLVDMLIILYATWIFLQIKAEWQNGFNACLEQACELCIAKTYNSSLGGVVENRNWSG